jgi:broad specificity phosphatase PhoE
VRIAAIVLSAALAAPAWADEALWHELATGRDLVVLMRHTEPSGGDPLAWDESGRCAGESMLTSAGKAHAQRIGEAFSRRGIKPVVVSSPMCRCRDTAQIAFRRAPLTDGSLREVATADSNRLMDFERKAQAMIASERGAAPVVFVNHRPNIDRLTMELIESGELLVGRVSPTGEVNVLGRIKVP